MEDSTFSMSALFWQLSRPRPAGRELVGRAVKVTTPEEGGCGPSGPGPLTSPQPCASPLLLLLPPAQCSSSKVGPLFTPRVHRNGCSINH